jgi:hypothetical protein
VPAAAEAERYAAKRSSMKWLPLGLALCLSGLAIAAVPISPATPEAMAQARELLLKSFATPDALRHTTLLAQGVAVGPRLWAASAAMRKGFSANTKDMYGVVDPQLVAKWKLSPLDIAAVPESARPALTEATQRGIPVLHGAITSRTNEVLSAMVIDQAKPEAFPFSVRRPSESELEYYYGLIPYDLKEPIFVVESSAHAFLVHIGDDGKLFYVEML